MDQDGIYIQAKRGKSTDSDRVYAESSLWIVLAFIHSVVCRGVDDDIGRKGPDDSVRFGRVRHIEIRIGKRMDFLVFEDPHEFRAQLTISPDEGNPFFLHVPCFLLSYLVPLSSIRYDLKKKARGKSLAFDSNDRFFLEQHPESEQQFVVFGE